MILLCNIVWWWNETVLSICALWNGVNTTIEIENYIDIKLNNDMIIDNNNNIIFIEYL